nr:DUF3025 domain-containing protein [Paucibacter sp. B51]
MAEALNAQLRAGPPVLLEAGPLRFVAQDELPEGEAYEAFIHRSACVPTRDNAHDLFNGLVWLHWPGLKTRLNALHLQALTESGGVQAQRGPLRDALTLLDENAAFLQGPEPLLVALRDRDWTALFGRLRPLWVQARLQLVGHALMEKLLQPRKPICAHVLILPEAADAQDASGPWLAPEFLRHKPFLPLPVLGVPGWWPANENADFYADPGVFRPGVRVQTG